MTMTASVPGRGVVWAVDDLADLPDKANRYEIIEGSLLVSPAPAKPHFRALSRLQKLLNAQSPAGFDVGQNAAVTATLRDNYFIPDLIVVRTAAADLPDAEFKPDEIELAVEVLSPGRRGIDLVTKRHHYAAMGIPLYWVVDPEARTITVMELDGDTYRVAAEVGAGQRLTTDRPFPLDLDPAGLG